MFQCFRCGEDKAVWQSDYTFEDMGMEGEGVSSLLHCFSCGSEIIINTPIGESEEE